MRMFVAVDISKKIGERLGRICLLVGEFIKLAN